MGTFELEEIKNIIYNIGKYHSLRFFKKKIETEQTILKQNEELIKELKKIFEVGFSIQHLSDYVKGFATNIFNYVLSGLCIISTRHKLITGEFKDSFFI